MGDVRGEVTASQCSSLLAPQLGFDWNMVYGLNCVDSKEAPGS